MSNDLFLDDVNVLVPVWLGGGVATAQASPLDAGFLGRYLVTVASSSTSIYYSTSIY